MSIRIEVIAEDVFTYDADVLALKFAQALYGVDAAVVTGLTRQGRDVGDRLPPIGECSWFDSSGVVAAREVLFVGVEPFGRFDYLTIRRFAAQAVAVASRERPAAAHLAMTLHGRGFGLDEEEAFRAEVAGILDTLADDDQTWALARVSIVERDAEVASRLRALLLTILPTGEVTARRSRQQPEEPSLRAARSHLGAVGHDSSKKPHVFVAMPFADEYSDRFHYGISSAVKAAGLLCERADLASFTGDVVTWVKERIDSAALVVADLSGANPNVYLEVGYAWGRGVSTVLLLAEGDDLTFDTRAQRCLIFKSIRHLEQMLTREILALGTPTGQRGSGAR